MQKIRSTVLIWICYLSVVVVHIMADCSGVGEDSGISVCTGMEKDNISSEIYLNAHLSPLSDTYNCECVVIHNYATLEINIEAEESNLTNLYFLITTVEFKADGNISLTNKTTVIQFQVKSNNHRPAGCLVLKSLHVLERQFSIKCYKGNETHIQYSTVLPKNKETTTKTGDGGTNISNEQTTHANVSTERIEGKDKNKQDYDDLNIGVIAGAAGGGVALVIVVIIIVVICKRGQNSNNNAQSSDNARKETDYDMTENAMYNCDESDNKPKTNSTAAQEVEYEYVTSDGSKSFATASGAYDNAIEQKFRPNNDLHLENENEYNHVDQSHTKTPPNTGNIYNVLKSGNTTENDLDENDYDCTENSNKNYRQNASSLYSKAV